MMLLPDSPTSLYITSGLNNIVAKETRVEPKPINDDASQRSAGPTPTDRLKYHIWPAFKKGISSGLAEGSKMGRKNPHHQPSSSNPAFLPPISFEPTELKPAALLSNQSSFSAKRQIHLAELGRAPMTADHVHGPRMDSPTIPGRFPIIHGRSISAPEAATGQSMFERSFQEPVSEPFILLPQDDYEKAYLQLHQTKVEEQIEEEEEQKEEDKPPAVPPKSPRLTGSPRLTSPSTTTLPDLLTSSKPNNDSSLPPRAATAMELRPREPHIVTALHWRNESVPTVQVSSGKAQLKSSQFRPKHKYERSDTSRDRSKRRRSLRGEVTAVTETSFAEKIKFAQLPVGFHVPEAKSQFTSSDVEKLEKQAKTQAEKFKVLPYHEVKVLSKELRVLDARCDYLRSTSKALRAGRNQFHARVIAHLRSSRSASNSRENLLGQEEALAQIDKSIDEWTTKLEQVDNRRARVRQMLLEHIAASLILSAVTTSTAATTAATTAVAAHHPVADVKPEEDQFFAQTRIEDDNLEDAAEIASLASVARESIKIYADCGVYSDADMADLLADIEHQMKTMSGSPHPNLPT